VKNTQALIRYRATRSWIVQGSQAICFATDEDELIRVELDKETANLLREKIPEGVWPAC
jgi:hypothetical protein